ncbi:carboxylesterase family domain-containing protein [Phthorimaea operculella]|nr:carboxylesterase family domain-containing protein [Phthorimaea operculella]
MWLRRVLCLLTLYQCTQATDLEVSRVVNTTQGPVVGFRTVDPNQKPDLFMFYSIPYAKAPTGQDKFKAPLPPPVWTVPYPAIDKGIICPQPNSDLTKIVQEDCLIVNVYVPDTNKTNLPVVFYIHPGAYQTGYGEMFSPRTVARTGNVIYQSVKLTEILNVTFNYRLGVHGFLSMGTPDIPGNAGMKDQVAALRWVKRNIASFGGNPNNIAIHGSSAGASSADLLCLSPMAKDLFHRVIADSGGSPATWSVQIDPLQNAKEFAKEQNFQNVDDFWDLELFYKTASYDVLTNGTYERLVRKDNDFVFTPSVERDQRDAGVERFLTDNPDSILKSGNYTKVPMLYGFGNMEGMFRISLDYNTFKDGMNAKFSDYLPRDLHFTDDVEKENEAKKIYDFYFDGQPVSGETIQGYIDYFTDILFAYPILRSVLLQVEAGNTDIYLYQFSFPLGMPPMPEGAKNVSGANHCAQTVAVMDLKIWSDPEGVSPEVLEKVKNVTRQFWVNFITTGTPVPAGSPLPAWPAAGNDRSPHMEITDNPQLLGTLLPLQLQLEISWLLAKIASFHLKYNEHTYCMCIPTGCKGQLSEY